ncbi:metal-dependent transcriptional regulator [Desulfosporosinus youngiae]|uniref:Mn-dependent transcriptional regulator n=1 Tax=Desulfosporosinus youngiae DSM 17734 TaxID=768710 RepID=H5XS48_9FIRM|nr:metal-dependent transcriptional regulator [Desulfosporosinus youngiae]EHQ87660.1 Mn-dependent transcriptional regulator [Desulfosporosinus youngiae DSM 17734]
MTKDTIILTPALEDYLEVILELDETENEIRVTDVAEKLNIAKSTVTITLNKLKGLGLVTQESYGPILLTRAGKLCAVDVKNRHRVLRKFLVEVLGVDYQTADKDACLMEHVVSPVTMKRMAEFIVKTQEAIDSKK